MTGRPALLLAALLLALGPSRLAGTSPAHAQTSPAAPVPTQATPTQATPRHHMIVTANPLATQAGLAVLRAGGSAIDAAIAAQAVLGVVEPQASGLGGGAVMLAYDAATHATTAWDGRETAPAAAGPALFLDAEGKPLGFHEAGVGGRAVGVPGALRMLEAAHRHAGRLPWARLFDDAIRLADEGFEVSPRLAAAIAENAPRLAARPAARALYLDANGAPLAAGARLVNHPMAETLRAIAAGGADALLRGPIAAAIATAVRTDPNPGLLTADDLASYTPKKRAPICTHYRVWVVCGMGPPSSGGSTVSEILGLLAHFNLPADPPENGAPAPMAAHLLVDASRLAWADRRLYLADTDFVPVPLRGLLAPDYLTARAQLISQTRALAEVAAGNPDWSTPDLAPEPPQPEHGTSHLSIVDDAGDAISLTTTVQDVFGSRIVVGGFVLNNELTDFSFAPALGGRPVANRVAPGKRPLSSMSPTLVFDTRGNLRFVLGSAGGARIIGDVAEALLALLDWHLSPAEAVALAHVSTTGATTDLEENSPASALSAPLAAQGHQVQSYKSIAGLQIIALTPEGLRAAADPHREGTAASD